MKCPECQHEYADRIPKCPYCGGLGITPSLPEEEAGITIYYKNIALKTAGVVLLLSAACSLAPVLINMMKSGKTDFTGAPSIIDIILGFSILYGSSKALLWTKIRAWFGLILGAIIFFIIKDYYAMALQSLYCLSLLGLIAENPGKKKIIFCLLFFIIYFGFVFYRIFNLFFLIDSA